MQVIPWSATLYFIHSANIVLLPHDIATSNYADIFVIE